MHTSTLYDDYLEFYYDILCIYSTYSTREGVGGPFEREGAVAWKKNSEEDKWGMTGGRHKNTHFLVQPKVLARLVQESY